MFAINYLRYLYRQAELKTQSFKNLGFNDEQECDSS